MERCRSSNLSNSYRTRHVMLFLPQSVMYKVESNRHNYCNWCASCKMEVWCVMQLIVILTKVIIAPIQVLSKVKYTMDHCTMFVLAWVLMNFYNWCTMQAVVGLEHRSANYILVTIRITIKILTMLIVVKTITNLVIAL